jgi:hypothetical protein
LVEELKEALIGESVLYIPGLFTQPPPSHPSAVGKGMACHSSLTNSMQSQTQGALCCYAQRHTEDQYI